ncbi:DUF2079 domain-containing protein [Tardisphaera miroshnichenkoae]
MESTSKALPSKRVLGFFGPAIADPFLLILIALYLAFSVYWSWISIMKYFALNASVWDLGVNMDSAWYFIWDPLSALGLLYKPILWVIFPLFLPKSYPIILTFQAFFASFAAFPIYWIAKRMLKNRFTSLLIASSYFIFPLAAGMYWFDWHYQVMFVTLFPLGYLLYLKRRFAASFVAFALSGFTRYPYFALVAGFATILVAEGLYERRRGLEDRDAFRFSLALLLFWLLYAGFVLFRYAGGDVFGLLTGFEGTAHFVAASSPQEATPFLNIDYKIFNLALIFLPFLGLPLLSKRFAPLTLVYVYITIYSNSWTYQFPASFKLQYGPLIIPFLYLGFIDALSSLRGPSGGPVAAKLKAWRASLSQNSVKFAALMIVIMALLASVYEPFGPFNNKYTQGYFDVGQETQVNWVRYDALEKVTAMIPYDDPYFITQNNIPEVFPRPGSTEIGLQEVTNFANNYMYVNNQVLIYDLYLRKYVSIDYALFDFAPNAYMAFNSNAGNPKATVPYLVARAFYDSGDYGIVAYADGVFLLKKGYHGPIQYYVPYAQFYPSSLFANVSTYLKSTPENENILEFVNVNRSSSLQKLWYGPWTDLGPGTYSATFELETNNTSASNSLELSVLYDYGAHWVGTLNVNGSEFKADTWVNFTVPFALHNFENSVEFPGWSTGWNGTILIKGVYVQETGKPNSTFDKVS